MERAELHSCCTISSVEALKSPRFAFDIDLKTKSAIIVFVFKRPQTKPLTSRNLHHWSWGESYMTEELKSHYDVLIIGAGLAGLSLSTQLLKYTDKTILLLDKWDDPPRPTQKVGESLVQLSGYYFSKILDLEDYLMVNQYLKYNLRFYWQTGAGKHDFWEDVSSSSIKTISNIATFQLDRNHIEKHMMARAKESPRFQFLGGVRDIAADLSENDEPHSVSFNKGQTTARWVVDCS